MNDLVITRHADLVDYMREIRLINADAEILSHVSDPSVLEGRNVFGVLPLPLAALAESITIVPLNTPAEVRGTELTLDQLRIYAGTPETYVVRRKED